MGQIIASTDEGSVNELFLKVFNAWPEEAAPTQSRSLGNNLANVAVGITCSARSVALAVGARPINLRTSASNPPVQYSGLHFRVHTRVHGRAEAAGRAVDASVEFDTDLNLSGGAVVNVATTADSFLAQLQLTVTDIAFSFPAQRQAFVDAVRGALQAVDTNPVVPGKQGLPGAAINAGADLAGQAFDTLAGPAADALRALVRQHLAALRLTLGVPVPRQLSTHIPHSPNPVPVSMAVNSLQVAIAAERVTLTATFA